MSLKRVLLRLWAVDEHVRRTIAVSRFFFYKIPLIGKYVSLLIDRILLIVYAVDLMSFSVDVRHLSVSHPNGVLLGGNGIVSTGRLVVMAGVKLVGRSPDNEEYLKRHAEKRVFVFGDNVVIGTNSVVIGPVVVCDNVLIGAMSLVNCDILESGVYVGSPVRRIGDFTSDEWVRNAVV